MKSNDPVKLIDVSRHTACFFLREVYLKAVTWEITSFCLHSRV